MSRQEENTAVLNLLQEMNQYNMILYVGTGAKPEDLSEEVCNLTWRCVVTTQKRADFGKEFTNGRKVKRYTQYADLPSNLFNNDDLTLIQIYGNEGKEDSGIDDSEEENYAKLKRSKDADKIMNRLFRRIDVRCKMVIIGYNPDDSQELPLDDFRLYWEEMQGGELSFFGIPEKENAGEKSKKLIKYASRQGYFCGHCSLAGILSEMEKEDIDFGGEVQQKRDQNLFYKGGKPVSIETSILLRCRNFAQLLTEESVYKIRPMGRIQQSMWYYNFLANSADWPQWYGYLPQSEFHLKREFEDTLVDLVKDVIAGKKGRLYDAKPTVILEGDPGNSKSITLGALAYRIYSEKINPVVYIKNDDLLFNTANSQEFDQLDELLQVIEDLGEKDVRTLILWDSATYRNITSLAADLVQRLDNRGRRFVLVCTAYSGASQSIVKGANQADIPSNGKVISTGQFYFLKTRRGLTDSELFQFKKQAKRLLDIDQDTFNSAWEKLKKNGNNDIFNYFYYLVDMIRPRLESGLSNERKEVSSYVNKQLVLLGAKKQEEDKSENVLYQALKDAGVQISDEEAETIEKGTKKTSYYNLDKFNICIAMFSQFKLDVPYALGIHMLYNKNAGGKAEFYQNKELFQLITTDIPWIYYGENGEGNFVFKFRNSLEAELFLDRNSIEAEQQIDMICDMLDYYAEIYKEEGCEDEEIMYSLQRLMRMIGPNTTYQQFQPGGSRETLHINLLKNLDRIIKKLSGFRIDQLIPDEDAEFASIEVTFIREYYGNLWENLHDEEVTEGSYTYRMENLEMACNLALEKMSQLEYRRVDPKYNYKEGKYTSRINALSVESARCNIELEKLESEYKTFCKEQSIPYIRAKINFLPYRQCFQNLVKAIMTDPFNGYTYNALFSLFENEYEKYENDKEHQLQLLSEARVYADDALSVEINNRGMYDRDELSEHIEKIMEYSDGFSITIDDVINDNKNSSFKRLFDQLLEKNSASGIIFVCQRELDKAGLGYKKQNHTEEVRKEETVLSTYQIGICKKILDFMKREDYETCIINDSYALYLLLQVTWMYYNRRPLNTNREAQLTYINDIGWQEINMICEQYTKCCRTNRRPIVVLIQSLSLLHLNRNYIQADRKIRELNEDMFGTVKRMRVPYLFCDENGIPYLYSGTVLSVKNNTGFIQVDNIPKNIGRDHGIRFYMKNLGLRKMPSEKEIENNLELGLGYMGFSLYTKEGRSRLEGED